MELLWRSLLEISKARLLCLNRTDRGSFPGGRGAGRFEKIINVSEVDAKEDC